VGKSVKRVWEIKEVASFCVREGWAEKGLLHFVLFASDFTFPWGTGYKRSRREGRMEGYRLKKQGQGQRP